MEETTPTTAKAMKMDHHHHLLHLDFISELPDSVLLHILSFLDMIFVVRTSILSKRWRYLWASLAFLNFNEEVFDSQFIVDAEPISKLKVAMEDPYFLDTNHQDPFMDFVHRVLLLHCKSNMHTFTLSCDYPWLKKNNWFRNCSLIAIRRNDQEIEHRRTLDLPHWFYTCNKSLTYLKLDMGSKKGRPFFKIPDVDSVDLPCLKTLHLESLFFIDGGGVSGFFSRCLVLETLIISNCLLEERNDLNISALQLKYLQISLCRPLADNVDEKSKITVFAPKLTHLECRGQLLREFYLDFQNVAALLNAEIDGRLAGIGAVNHYQSAQRNEDYAQNVSKFLKDICNVESLTLYMRLLEDVFDVPPGFGDLLNPFCNLRFLMLKTRFDKEHISCITILEMCPHLETLVLKRTMANYVERKMQMVTVYQAGSVSNIFSLPYQRWWQIANPEELWEMKEPCRCLSFSLKYVEVWDVYGCIPELKFLKFLLKNSMVLEKMVVCTSKSQSLDLQTSFKIFTEKLVTLPKASPNVVFSFSKLSE